MIEPKIGEIFSLHGIKVKTCSMRDNEKCNDCAFAYLNCSNIVCNPSSREDSTQVIFKEVEQTKIKPMEVKIQIPDNCELVKDGDTYIVRERKKRLKKKEPPRSWREFCEKSPIKASEAYINYASEIETMEEEEDYERDNITSKNLCISAKEAEAFLALMQLRQLRKAWVGDWEPNENSSYWSVYNTITMGVMINSFLAWNPTLTFPTKTMAEDFLNCFRDLCETAKILL